MRKIELKTWREAQCARGENAVGDRVLTRFETPRDKLRRKFPWRGNQQRKAQRGCDRKLPIVHVLWERVFFYEPSGGFPGDADARMRF